MQTELFIFVIRAWPCASVTKCPNNLSPQTIDLACLEGRVNCYRNRFSFFIYSFSYTSSYAYYKLSSEKMNTPKRGCAHSTVHVVCQSAERGSNEAPISGAEMNLKRKCKLGENSAEMVIGEFVIQNNVLTMYMYTLHMRTFAGSIS